MPRQTDWVDTNNALVITAGSQQSLSLITGLSPGDMRGATLIRTIVRMSLSSTSVAGAWGVQKVDVGIGITSQEAFAAGVLPDPSVSSDRPSRGWVYRDHIAVAQNGAGSPVLEHIREDIRGARKIENGELFLVIDNTDQLGTSAAIRAMFLVRVLVKLP